MPSGGARKSLASQTGMWDIRTVQSIAGRLQGQSDHSAIEVDLPLVEEEWQAEGHADQAGSGDR
jgi:hypothetical protein